jgi:hypothetical protein
VLLALVPLTAAALTTHLSAVGVDVTGGLGVQAPPVRATGGGVVALGWFRGQFDDQFSFGRYWWVGPTGRVDVGIDGWRVTPMVELRRGLDLLVAGVSYGVAGGAVVTPEGTGWTARGVGIGRFRRTRALSFTSRLEAGVDGVGGAVGFAGGLTVGVTLASPLRALDP